MNRLTFRRWVLGKYRPRPISPADGSGGYIVPRIYYVDKKGFFGMMFRKVGWLMCNKKIYRLGLRRINLREAITNSIRKASIER